MFAFALVLQPALAGAAELHELAHDPTGGHQHTSHSIDVSDELASTNESGDGAATLHTLLHFSHSCGESAAEVPALPPIAFTPMRHPLLVSTVQMPAQPRLPTPFKPPISV